MKHCKRLCSVAAALVISALCILPSSALGDPEVYLKAGEGAKVGDTVSVTLSMKNVVDFTSADFVITYNPYMLSLVKVTECSDMTSDKDINLMHTDVPANGAVDDNGEPVSEFGLTMFHVFQFPQKLENCDVVTLDFKVLSGGDCPVVLSLRSFYINDKVTTPLIHSLNLNLEGDKSAKDWNYAEHIAQDVEFTDSDYTFSETKKAAAPAVTSNSSANKDNTVTEAPVVEKSKISKGAVIGIVVVVVAAAAVIAVVIASSRKNTIIEEE